jgi:hypothetical protein
MMNRTIPDLPRRRCTALAAGSLLFISAVAASAQDTIPYPSALDAAAVMQTDISNIASRGMIVGNGEMNGIVYSSGNDMYVRVTKNDVWDGRVNTSGDPALPVINPATHSFTGANGAPCYGEIISIL